MFVVFIVYGLVGFVEGKQLSSPATFIISGACPPLLLMVHMYSSSIDVSVHFPRNPSFNVSV